MANYWQGKRVVLTGGTGFLGKHLARTLQTYGASVYVPSRSNGEDLRYRGTIRTILHDEQPDMVIHAAGSVGGIGANQSSPATFIYDNLIMGAHLINEAHICGIAKFVTIGTVCSYPKHAPTPFDESSLWDGYPEETNAPYGIAKKTLLAMGQAYRQQHGMNVIHVLPTNLYGEGDSFDLQTSHIIPAAIRKLHNAMLSKERHVMMWGSGSPTRDFLYAQDAVNGILAAAELYNDPDPVNLGSGREIHIWDVVDEIAHIIGYKGQIVWDTSKPDGQPRRVLNSSKAFEAFGWKAQTPLLEGLSRTVDYYLTHVLEAAAGGD